MIKRVIKYIILSLILISICFVLIVEVFGNFYKVDKDVYRSGILNEYNLSYYLKKHEIKTILNLNGPSSKNWYKKEKDISKNLNLKYIDYKLSNSEIYGYEETSALLKVIKNAEKPLLIHCIGGADRTSLATAIYTYATKGMNKTKAESQLSWVYGHLPSIRPHVKAMDYSFDIFVKGFDTLK